MARHPACFARLDTILELVAPLLSSAPDGFVVSFEFLTSALQKRLPIFGCSFRKFDCSPCEPLSKAFRPLLSSLRYSVLLSVPGPGHGFGPIPAPCGLRRFCFAVPAPSGFWLPHSGSPRKAAPCLGSGGLSLPGAPGHTGRKGEKHVSQQTHSHRLHRRRR